MKINSLVLLQNLKEMTLNHLQSAKEWKELPLDTLQKRPKENAWNALECLEHLNFYGDFYLIEIEKQLKNSSKPSQKYFHSGILGNYFAKMMVPKEKGGKMKTFKEMNPMGQKLDQSVIEKFIFQQEKMLELLDLATHKNLTKIKTSISITNWIKLRIGDTFRVVINHNERHMQQARKALFA
jgi:hypothetical protein